MAQDKTYVAVHTVHYGKNLVAKPGQVLEDLSKEEIKELLACEAIKAQVAAPEVKPVASNRPSVRATGSAPAARVVDTLPQNPAAKEGSDADLDGAFGDDVGGD